MARRKLTSLEKERQQCERIHLRPLQEKPVSVLTPAELNTLMSEVWGLWQGIGSDLESACAEGGERLDNETVVETLLDAQRLEEEFKQQGGRAKTIEAAASVALKKKALEKFRLLKYEEQCRIITAELGPFV